MSKIIDEYERNKKTEDLNNILPVVTQCIQSGTQDFAKSLSEALLQAGYCKLNPNIDFVIRAGDAVNIREKAYKDAQKETATQILQSMNSFKEEFMQFIEGNLRPVGANTAIIDVALYSALDRFRQEIVSQCMKYGITLGASDD